MSSSHEEAKAEADAAWKAGRFGDAVSKYGEAIGAAEGSGAGRDVVKVLYSNRSAANHKLGKFDAALVDAQKCVDLDAQWAKGFSRKGAALYSLRRFTDAYNAYNSVLRIDPGDPAAAAERDRCMNAIASTNGSSSSGSGSGSSSTASSPPSSASGRLGMVEKYLRYVVLISFVAYMLPVGSVSRLAYRAFLGSALGATLIAVS